MVAGDAPVRCVLLGYRVELPEPEARRVLDAQCREFPAATGPMFDGLSGEAR